MSTIPKKPTQDILDWFKANLRYDNMLGGITRKDSTEQLGWNSQRYRRWCYKNQRYLIHHIVWFLCKGHWPVSQLDHKDRNRSNNRIDNLRYATHSENCQNANLTYVNTSGYKGVWQNRNGLYVVNIGVNGKQIRVGSSYNKQEAIEMRKQAENKYWNS